MTVGRVAGAVAAVAMLVAGCGDDGPDAGGLALATGTTDVPRTVEIAMVDLAYAPTAVSVRSGETVEFVFVNDGAVRHEAIFGNETEQAEHGALMRQSDGSDMDGMDMGGETDAAGEPVHDGAVAPLVIEPGASETVIVTFDDDNTSSTVIGCHEPGHWEAGMRVDVSIVTA